MAWHETLDSRHKTASGPSRLCVFDAGEAGEEIGALRGAAPVDMRHGPLVRGDLVREGEGRWRLVVTGHPLVVDSEALRLLTEELFSAYEDRITAPHRPPTPGRPLAPVPSQPANGPAVASRRVARRSLTTVTLGETAAHGLSRLVTACGTSPEAVCAAAWSILLTRLAGQPRFELGVFSDGPGRAGSPGRSRACAPLLVDLSGVTSFVTAAHAVEDLLRSARTTGERPADTGADPAGPLDSLGLAGPVGFAYLERHDSVLAVTGLEPVTLPARWWTADDAPSAHPLVLRLVDAHGKLFAGVAHAPGLLDETGARLWATRLAALLTAAARDPLAAPGSLPVMSPAEYRAVVAEPNATIVAPPAACHADLTLCGLVDAQARRTPEAVAVVHEGTRLSYAELCERSNRLAHELCATGVGPGARVAVLPDRGPEAVVALLAVMKAGGAFVPVDPAYPTAHIAHMLDDSGAAVVLTGRGSYQRLPPAGGKLRTVLPIGPGDGAEYAHRPATAPDVPLSPADLAYVVYTSGSTGRPKGVLVEHRGIVSYLLGMLHHFPMGPRDRMLQATSLSFDVSVYEIFLPLLTGGAVVLPRSGSHTDARYLGELITEQGVTGLHMVPSLLRLVVPQLDPERCRGLRRVFVSGEPLDGTLVAALHDRLEAADVVNLYGATEVSVDSTWWIPPRDGRTSPVLVGRPMANATAYVLDGGMRAVPAGVVGEVFLGGASVTRGYHRRAALTAQRFVPDPFGAPGARLYRTGDLGRLTPGGELELLGRIDHQVKLHGRRIEPGEIEATMVAHPSVTGAAVVAEGDREQARLVGFFTGTLADPAELRSFLLERLPGALVPAALVRLDSLPLSPNGKTDRAALALLASCPHEEADGAPPQGPPRPGAHPAGGWEPLVREAMSQALGGVSLAADDDFFAHGGNSLHATRLVARLRAVTGSAVGVRTVYDHSTPARLAEALDTAEDDGSPPAAPAHGTGLSSAQHRMWLLSQLSHTPAEYTITVAHRLTGRLDVDALAGAMDAVTQRHGALRSCFPERDGVPVRREAATRSLALQVVPPKRGESPDETLRRVLAEQVAALDLAHGPLFRPALVPLAEDDHLLVIVLHHIIGDGWSTDVLLKDLAACYRARVSAGTGPREPAAGYERYLDAERRRRQDGTVDRDLEYFTDVLGDAPDEVTFPLDRPRPPQRTGRGAALHLEFGADTCAAVRELAADHRTTPFSVLLAGLSALLHRTGGHRDVVLGSAVAGRFDAGLEDVVGLCLNSVALRWPVEPGTPFTTLVERAGAGLLSAMEHSAAPFAQVVERLGAVRDARRTPVFQIVALYDEYTDVLDLPGVTARVMETDDGSAQCDAVFTFSPARDGGLSLKVEYCTDVYQPDSVRRWAGQLETLLTAAARSPHSPVRDLPLMPPDQVRAVLEAGRGGTGPLPDATVADLFSRQAASTPDRTAVVTADRTLDYRELDERSSRLAHALRARGVVPGTPVALCVTRGADTLIAVLGVLKAGGGYVPIEPDTPPERVDALLTDSAVRFAVTQRRWAHLLGPTVPTVLLVDDPATTAGFPADSPAPVARPADLAYVIYTSGSTGHPKGVMVEHRSVVNYLTALQDRFGLTPHDRLLLKSPLSFDVSVREVFWALCTGACLVVAEPRRHADPDYLVELIERERVTVAHFVPSMLHVLLETLDGPGRCPTLRQVMTSGETLPVQTARRCLELLPGELRNMYGPTETTVEMTDWDVRGWTEAERLPIGRPFPHTRVYVLDELLRPVPVGTVGELYVGGAPVARGYLGRPALTAERFLPDPYGPAGSRMYRTGDLGRLTADGLLDFHGRNDFQVQLRGHRIELGEIESLLCRQPGVRTAVAVVRRADVPEAAHLVAYAVTDSPRAPGAGARLRAALAARLPSYMLPTAVVTLDGLPLTVNGKLDRAALPAPHVGGEVHTGPDPRTRAPGGRTARVIARIWRELLEVPEVGPDDNFFSLGGHSLLLATLAARIRTELGVRVPLPLLLGNPVLRDLAAALPTEDDDTGAGLRPRPEARDRAPLSAAQRRVWVEEQIRPGTPTYTVPEGFRLHGPLDETAFEAAWGDLVRRHDALRSHVTGHERPELTVSRDGPSLRRIDLRVAGAPGERELLEREVRRVFPLDGPLVSGTLARLADDVRLFLFTAHHLVVDGWSLDVLWKDLERLYRRHREGAVPPPEMPRLTFTDYTWWEREQAAGSALEPHLAFWSRELTGVPGTALPLPPLPAEADTVGLSRTVALGTGLSEQLRTVAAELGATPFLLTLTAFGAALAAELPGEPVIGVETANRTDARTAELVGLFINHVPLRLRGLRGTSVREALNAVNTSWQRVLGHAHVPFDTIVDHVGHRERGGRPPGSEVAFSYLDQRATLRIDGLHVERMAPRFNGTTKFGLLLEVFDTPDGIVGVFEHRPHRIDRGRMNRVVRRWEAALFALLTGTDASLEALS
ncbi:amino acid adenylation domain-containing protein [Streptomyces roseolilacinus]|uniref:amino acid adenylation domain-containing protein n=1 Tax=Streptomyces roseolilacinus TaxID=66904 RepID=UPI00381152E5